MKFKKALRQWFVYVVMPLAIPLTLALFTWLAMLYRNEQIDVYVFGLIMVLACVLVAVGFILTARQVDADDADEKTTPAGDVTTKKQIDASKFGKMAKWYDSPAGMQGFMAGTILALVAVLIMAMLADSGKNWLNAQQDKDISNLLKQDVATLVVKRLKDGANSKDFTPEQLQHYFDNRLLYREIEQRIIAEKNAELVKQVRGSY